MTLIRFTRQRQAVLEYVRSSDKHPDAARVFEAVRRVIPSISLGTVYRSLEVLVREGLIITISRPGEPTRFDARTENHQHFICDVCKEVSDLLLPNMPDLIALARNASLGSEVRELKIEFHGTCAHCLQLRETDVSDFKA